jgi:hypothetical protein
MGVIRDSRNERISGVDVLLSRRDSQQTTSPTMTDKAGHNRAACRACSSAPYQRTDFASQFARYGHLLQGRYPVCH